MIIGIVGWMSSGKDTIADRLVQDGFPRMSYAGALKDAVADVFNWDRQLLEGTSPEGREWRETVDEWWANKLQLPDLTPRWVLQQWGTEVCRHGFHDNIWIASLENKIQKMNQDVVISDCRFPNEIASVKDAGGQIWWVQRGPLPRWYPSAVAANAGNPGAIQKMKAYGVHISEWAWVGSNIDHIISNDGTLDDLHNKVADLIYQLRSS